MTNIPHLRSEPAVTKRTEHRRNVWLSMVDGRNTEDLAILDAHGFDTWRANPRMRRGDLVLMYRTRPFSDMGYVFAARSDARAMTRWFSPYAVDLADGFRLPRVITLDELRRTPSLQHWDFLKNARGFTKRRADLQEQGAWPGLRRLLEERAPQLRSHFGSAWTGQRRHRRYLFLSYASQDKRKVQELYLRLSRHGLDVWLDAMDLQPAEDWDRTIEEAIAASRAFIVCVSDAWLRRRGFVKKELDAAFAVSRGRRNFIVPIALTKCHIPNSLSKFQSTLLFGADKQMRLDRLCRRLRRLQDI